MRFSCGNLSSSGIIRRPSVRRMRRTERPGVPAAAVFPTYTILPRLRSSRALVRWLKSHLQLRHCQQWSRVSGSSRHASSRLSIGTGKKFVGKQTQVQVRSFRMITSKRQIYDWSLEIRLVFLFAMSLLREVKPRNARTARIVKAREPQPVETRKRVLLLHGTKCPVSVSTILKTFTSLTKPHCLLLKKKNENIHPFEDPSSLEFLALKNDCGLVVFGTHSKKRPNNITLLRVFDGRLLDMVELLLLTAEQDLNTQQKMQIGVEMKPMILFAGSQWEDTSSSDQATMYRTLRSLFLDLFQGEEIPSIEVAGLQHVLMIAAGEPASSTSMEDPANKPVIHLRWYRVKTMRSTSPKIPRVELEAVGPTFDFRVGRFREAEPSAMQEAMKHGRRPNEAKSKKNIEMDLVGDKIGKVHLGKQDLSLLQTRKMKGLKRTHKDLEDEDLNGDVEDFGSEDEDVVNGGVQVDLQEEEEDGGSSLGGTGDEISIGEGSDEEMVDGDENALPKRQKLA